MMKLLLYLPRCMKIRYPPYYAKNRQIQSLKINVIPNGLEKDMSFNINNNLIFINSFQFLNSSLDSLVKILEKMILSI